MSENIIETSATIYKISWLERPVEIQFANVYVKLLAGDKGNCTQTIVPKLQSAYDNTYGVGISPDAVKDMLEVLKEFDAVCEYMKGDIPAAMRQVRELAKAAINKSKL
jgi:hypothetical protein